MDTITPETPTTEISGATTDAIDFEPTLAVFAAPDAVTAEIVRGALEAEGIAAVIGEQVTDALAGPFAVGESFWGEVRVPKSEFERARALVAAFDAGDGALIGDETVATMDAV
jgi:hypothetical protein